MIILTSDIEQLKFVEQLYSNLVTYQYIYTVEEEFVIRVKYALIFQSGSLITDSFHVKIGTAVKVVKAIYMNKHYIIMTIQQDSVILLWYVIQKSMLGKEYFSPAWELTKKIGINEFYKLKNILIKSNVNVSV